MSRPPACCLNSSPARCCGVAGAGRAEGELAGLALRQRDQLLQRVRLDRRMADDQVRAEDGVGDRREVLDRVVVQLLVDERRDGVHVGVHDQRVAVGRGARHVVGADQPAAAGAVLDDHLAEALATSPRPSSARSGPWRRRRRRSRRDGSASPGTAAARRRRSKSWPEARPPRCVSCGIPPYPARILAEFVLGFER